MQTARQVLRESATVDAVEEFLQNLDEAGFFPKGSRGVGRYLKTATANKMNKGNVSASKQANASRKKSAQTPAATSPATPQAAPVGNATAPATPAGAQGQTNAPPTGAASTASTPQNPPTTNAPKGKTGKSRQSKGTQPSQIAGQTPKINKASVAFHDIHKQVMLDPKGVDSKVRAKIEALPPKEQAALKTSIEKNLQHYVDKNSDKVTTADKILSHFDKKAEKVKEATKSRAIASRTSATVGSVFGGQHTIADVAKQHPYATAGAVIGAGLLGRHMLKQRAKRQDKEAMYRAMYAQPQVVMQQPMQQSYGQSYGQGYGQYGY